MLELAILGLLKERPMHGYDLRKRMRGGFGLATSLSFGSLYPALARLERAGAVRELDPGSGRRQPAGMPEAEVIPLSGSLAGERAAFRARLATRATFAANAAKASAREAGTRVRKVYEITPAGEEMFAALLAEDSQRSEHDKSFVLRWSFARHLGADGRLRLLERHHHQLEDRLSEARRIRSAGGPSLERYERQIADHTIDRISRDLEWIEGLITAERSGPAAVLTETDAS